MRHLHVLLGAAVVAAVAAGCGNEVDGGAGGEADGGHANTGGSPATGSAGGGGSGSDEAPTFAGCETATAIDENSVEVTWQNAVDDTTPDDEITYTVYAFENMTTPPDTSTAVASQSFVGATNGVLTGLVADTTYYVLCRASDLGGNEDTNEVEQSAHTLPAPTPPTFGGATAAILDVPPTAAVKITWDEATDDQSAPDQISYDLFQSSAPGGEDFTSPPAMTVVGVTEAIVTLPSRTTAYWVVRARDAAGNDDGNTVEVSATTETSLDGDVQPIFASICTNCHSVTGPAGIHPFLDNTPVSYSELFQYGEVIPFDSANSVLYQYVTSPSSPAPLGSAEIAVIQDWIDQGAHNN